MRSQAGALIAGFSVDNTAAFEKSENFSAIGR